ncbi:uncharacterized protein LOC144096741 [Amblyomma americanum]
MHRTALPAFLRRHLSTGSETARHWAKFGAQDKRRHCGVSSIPVALMPSDGGAIRLNNPEAVQVALQSTSKHFMRITDVRQFGRGGILCRSPVEGLQQPTLHGAAVSGPRHLFPVPGYWLKVVPTSLHLGLQADSH